MVSSSTTLAIMIEMKLVYGPVCVALPPEYWQFGLLDAVLMHSKYLYNFTTTNWFIMRDILKS